MNNFIIKNPSHDIIYLNKERPLIFNQEYNQKYKKRQFDDIYSSPIFNELSFLLSTDYEPCQCLNTIEECPKLKDIIKDSKKNEAKTIFEHLKNQALTSTEAKIYKAMSISSEVLQPHFQSLLTVINIQNPEIIAELLRHVKTDYKTFWVYGLYISKFPSFNDLVQNIAKMIEERNLDIDLEGLLNSSRNELKNAYESSFLSIFKASFPSIVNLVCGSLKTELIIEKLMICHFIRGRQRKQMQVIKAAMQM